MFTLFQKVPQALELFTKCFVDEIKTEGTKLINEEMQKNDPINFLHQLVSMREKYSKIVKEACERESNLDIAMKNAFESFINVNNWTALSLAFYLDDLLKKGLRGLAESEIDTRLDNCIMIFRYLQDKDVFESYYKNALSKRLLNNKSISDEAEKAMILKLKTECGCQYT
jgi:cullin 3